MPNNLESIIKDLYELDPTLRSEDKAVREVVASLLSNKPVVLPDQVFVADLRAKLLVAHSTKPVNERPILSPWFMYLAPIGVVGVLIFMMVPKPLTHQAVPTMLNEAVELDSVADEPTESTSDAIDAKRSFVAPEAVPASGEMRTMEMALPVEVPGETFIISTQAPGQLIRVDFVAFTEPTFLVIQKDRDGMPGEVVGVSQVLNGDMSRVEIALMSKMLKDETFFATAYRDNGDGIYTPGKDVLVYDASGNLPLQQMFSTSPF
jgi:hypothetical protein